MNGSLRHSPAAERNREPILAELRPRLPVSGTVLEIASGTGQHIAHFASALPHLDWQPSDRDADLFDSVQAWASDAGNVRSPIELDVTKRPWPVDAAAAVYCANMIHIAPWAAAEGLVSGAASILAPGASLFLYGPFKLDGRHTAPSNEAFDESLRSRDPSWGIRDLAAVAEQAEAAGFAAPLVVDMPANNLFVTFQRR